MCLGELGQIVAVADGRADVRVGDRLRTVSLLTLDQPAEPGDWILVHSGFALGRLSAAEAREALHIRNDPLEEPS